MKLQLLSILILLIVTGNVLALQNSIFTTYGQTSTIEEGHEKIVGLKSHKIKDDNTLIGQVQNNASSAVSFVKIIATYYDQNGDIMGTDSTFSDPYDLKPNMKAPFQMSLGEDVVGGIGSYDLTITWRNTDGSEDSKVYEFTSISSNNGQQLQTSTKEEEDG